jgi:hypothetical protein
MFVYVCVCGLDGRKDQPHMRRLRPATFMNMDLFRLLSCEEYNG